MSEKAESPRGIPKNFIEVQIRNFEKYSKFFKLRFSNFFFAKSQLQSSFRPTFSLQVDSGMVSHIFIKNPEKVHLFVFFDLVDFGHLLFFGDFLELRRFRLI